MFCFVVVVAVVVAVVVVEEHFCYLVGVCAGSFGEESAVVATVAVVEVSLIHVGSC